MNGRKAKHLRQMAKRLHAKAGVSEEVYYKYAKKEYKVNPRLYGDN